MGTLFADFLGYRGLGMRKFQDVPDGEEGEHMWLGGMTQAATDAGAEVQFCMANAHTIMASLDWPGVTNARVNDDGGLNTVAIVLPSLLASALGRRMRLCVSVPLCLRSCISLSLCLLRLCISFVLWAV